jgi:hypothetical protein
LEISYLPSAASGYSNVFFEGAGYSIVKACPGIKGKKNSSLHAEMFSYNLLILKRHVCYTLK